MAMTVHHAISSARKKACFKAWFRMVPSQHGNMGDLGILPGQHTACLPNLKRGPVRVIKQDERLSNIMGYSREHGQGWLAARLSVLATSDERLQLRRG